ncbi:MAG TPA: DUF5906 domain-containing protein [Desulfovibrio sp.]|uniref:DUF5906 domain-containing protein n=1 Tax=Desulfovibrio sp. TaxID=885 RepID=UPI002C0EDF3E|nr:DUF5906 domain-containing protein [Desulfovibrio sp.]HMM37909.1 DUF5906 domain-containing protein [Desulfovibrio sp.]
MLSGSESPQDFTPRGTKEKNKFVSSSISDFEKAVNAFVDAVRSRDLMIDAVIADGAVHRVPASEKDRDKSGAYLMFPDAPYNGWFQNFRDGRGVSEWTWGGNVRPSTKEEREAQERRVVEAREKHRQEQAARAQEARRNAKAIWRSSGGCPADHPYLTRKRVGAHDDLRLATKGGEIIIPMFGADDELCSLQFIGPDGRKRFLAGGQIAGSFFPLPGDTSKPVYIAEGYATGATVHAATGASALIAFNCGNLRHVAEMVRARSGDRRIIIAADNDHATNENPGLTRGREAAEAVGGELVFPVFKEPFDTANLDGEGKPKPRTDWNDLALSEGLDVVRVQLESVKAEKSGEVHQEESPAEPEKNYPFKAEIEALNKKHAVVGLGGKFRIINVPQSDHDTITYSSLNDFRGFYANATVQDGNTLRSIADVWYKSPHRRQYAGVVFRPGQETPGYYNLWSPSPIKPRPGDWSLLREHIFSNICAGNQTAFDYVFSWCANLVQDPGGKRPGVALVLRGRRGVGKGVFVNNLGGLLHPRHFQHLTNQHLVTGRFNAHLRDALLVFADEAFWAGEKSAEGTLKGWITEDVVTSEAKGQDAISVENHMRVIIASNEDWCIPAGMEERRFCVLESGDGKIQRHSYFKAIEEQMNSGGREAMLHDLLQHEITVNLRQAPKTSGLMRQILHSFPPIHRFWFDCLNEGKIVGIDAEDDWPKYIKTDEMHKRFREHATDSGVRYRPTNTEFGTKLRELCPGLEYKQKWFSSTSRGYVYMLPDLRQCRAKMEEHVQMPIPWSDDDVIDSPPF